MQGMKQMTSNKKMDWGTPQWLFDELNKEFNFTLDPCANEFNHKCDKYYTEEDNGLSKSWENEVVFCNPPYGRTIGKWVKKCSEESEHATIVMLIPSRTDTKYFHKYLYKKDNVELRFIKGRLIYEGGNNHSSPFPSLIVVFNKIDKK